MVNPTLTPQMRAAVEAVKLRCIDEPLTWFTLSPSEIEEIHAALVANGPVGVWPETPTEEMLDAAGLVNGENAMYLSGKEVREVYDAFRSARKSAEAVPVARVVHKDVIPALGSATGRVMYTIHVIDADADLSVGDILYALRGGVS